ncbi:hypothetical protein CDAR_309991 [Caerostris darwini]|uniref:Uncharacterized protein n=1 Tax=Caerostris darwini TaxID=1538125 RepID=A0AAV4VX71_9ARAC|nr:hypothetical protein CDAR_309991 [Caerostris darwini]
MSDAQYCQTIILLKFGSIAMLTPTMKVDSNGRAETRLYAKRCSQTGMYCIIKCLQIFCWNLVEYGTLQQQQHDTRRKSRSATRGAVVKVARQPRLLRLYGRT